MNKCTYVKNEKTINGVLACQLTPLRILKQTVKRPELLVTGNVGACW